MSTDAARRFYRQCCERLLAARQGTGAWRGQLSPSALATAVACVALRGLGDEAGAAAVARGEAWLGQSLLADGSWGDSPSSQGNLSTTVLALAALRQSPTPAAAAAVQRAEAWVGCRAGGCGPEQIAAAILAHYGEDRTFSVPILTLCAVSGLLGAGPQAWRVIPQLPYELAALPRATFGALGLPVVSYALPALLAMGLARHRCGPRPWLNWRGLFAPAALRRLARLQPADGGFLEAVPLTGFVVLSLIAAGVTEHPVVRRGAAFLLAAQRPDGSWPIDADLATWVSTLSVGALAEDLPPTARPALGGWLLGQQFLTVHPYTGTAPGGWAWTDLPGGVPDADDTAGALLALHRLAPADPATRAAAQRGLQWLLDLANRDGGIPTFCRGWGRLPFDRSCPDITAHVLRAFVHWQPTMPERLQRRLRAAVVAGLAYLEQAQRPDGSWQPLWFGNEAAPEQANPVYGSARVLQALAEVLPAAGVPAGAWVERGLGWLLAAQHQDGGWGGDREVPPSVEETALAVSALASWPAGREASARGVEWLLRHQERLDQPAPIGLYFASLWYSEELYPLIFTTEALRRWLAVAPAAGGAAC